MTVEELYNKLKPIPNKDQVNVYFTNCDGIDVYGRREGAEPVTDVYHEKIYADDGWNTGVERNLILTNETNW